MVFKQVRLGDYFKFEKGLGYKGEFLAEESSVGLVGIDSQVPGGGYKENSEKPYSGPYKPEHVVDVGDVIVAATDITQDGSVLGSTLMIPESTNYETLIYSGDVMKALPLKPDEFSLEYFYNLYRVKKYRTKVAYGDTGTTVRRLSEDGICEQLVPLPDLPTQIAINEIISLIDHQISNSRALSRNLEALAQSIFKSWFIDFDPVKAKKNAEKPVGMDAETAKLFPDSFIKSDIGDIPKGWTIGSITEFAKQIRTNVKVKDMTSDVAYFGLEHLPRKSLFVFDWESAEEVSSNKSKIQAGDLLFGKLRPYFHKIVIAPVDGVCSTDIIVIEPLKEVFRSFMYLALNQESFVALMSNASSGTRMPRTSWNDMSDFQFIIPEPKILGAFESIVSELLRLGIDCVASTKELVQLRDCIIPSLILGELAVPAELIAS
jgi:type I restriction enzyme S subunit